MISSILRYFGYVSISETRAWQALAADADRDRRKAQDELQAIKYRRSRAVSIGNRQRAANRRKVAA